MIHLPALVMPQEFITLLKTPGVTLTAGSPVLTMLRSSPALSVVMERAFAEFNEHKIGLEKIAGTLGWANFRDRMASVYLFKALHGSFPLKTDMELVADIQSFEARFQDRSVHGNARLFLLGLYLKFFNIYLSMREDVSDEVKISEDVDRVLNLSKVKTDRPDLLILIVWHLTTFLGTAAVTNEIKSGIQWEAMFEKLSETQKFHLVSNLLSYGASIQEDDTFLFERI